MSRLLVSNHDHVPVRRTDPLPPGAIHAGEAGADPQDEEIIDKKGRGW